MITIGTHDSSQGLDHRIESRMRDYYSDLYSRELGLPDWEQRVRLRLDEEALAESKMSELETWVNVSLGPGCKALVVGGGTGAEFIAFSRRGCEAHAVEPNVEGVRIARLKAEREGLPAERFREGVGEALPYEKSTFDCIWCWTVLEHVQDVTRSVEEMLRVLKPGGVLFLQTPDYRQFYEPHYKLFAPMFLPKWMVKLWVRSKGRPVGFLDTLSFVTERQLRNLFMCQPVIAFRIIHSWPRDMLDNASLQTRLVRWMTRTLGIHRDQWWVLKKLAARR